MANIQGLGALSVGSSEVFGNATVTTAAVIEALDKIKEIPKQTKEEMIEVIQEAVINNLQDVIEIPWFDTALEYLPELIEILKLLS